MTYGQQPGGRRPNGQEPYGMAPQYGMYGAPQNGAGTMYNGTGGAYNVQPTYVTERAEHVSMTRAYGEMTIALVLTGLVAIVTQMTHLYERFIGATGMLGMWLPMIVEVGIAIYLGMRVMNMKSSTARVWFYVYAALMGFSLSVIFSAYSITTIGYAFLISAVFYLALTMFGLTTKANMLKAGPVLVIGLIVLIVTQVALMFVAPSDTMLKVVAAIGIVLFAGMTIYDAQFTKRVFAQYASQGPEMIKRVSILCALNLYLDFVNMFLYILQLLGLSRD
ncbi:MAG: Bax inhibitor-1/YccA family protein [Bifidobacterium criceti]|nr:Bax inhibitor-1/YccA family protein [Bifidobacterium criceti]